MSSRAAVPPQSLTIPFRSVVLFVVYLTAGNLCLARPLAAKWISEPVTTLSARWMAAMSRAMGLPVEATYSVVSFGTANLSVQEGCNGVDLALIFICAVLSYPVNWLRRLLGALFGTLVILGLNLFRLLNLLVIGAYFPEQFGFFHLWVWQPLAMLMTFGVLILWWCYFAGDLRGSALPRPE